MKTMVIMIFFFLCLNVVCFLLNCFHLLIIIIISEIISLKYLIFFIMVESVFDYTGGLFFFVFVASETAAGLSLLISFSYTSGLFLLSKVKQLSGF